MNTTQQTAPLSASQSAAYSDLGGHRVLFIHRDGEATISSRTRGRVRITNGGVISSKPVART